MSPLDPQALFQLAQGVVLPQAPHLGFLVHFWAMSVFFLLQAFFPPHYLILHCLIHLIQETLGFLVFFGLSLCYHLLFHVAYQRIVIPHLSGPITVCR